MTDQQAVTALRIEAERLWQIAIEARRTAAAKEQEYKMALFALIEAKVKEAME